MGAMVRMVKMKVYLLPWIMIGIGAGITLIYGDMITSSLWYVGGCIVLAMYEGGIEFRE